jgi:hypothetical protein
LDAEAILSRNVVALVDIVDLPIPEPRRRPKKC